MKKVLLPALLMIIFGLANITPFGTTFSTGQQKITNSNYDRIYTFNVEHKNHKTTHTLYVSIPPSLYDYYRTKDHTIRGEREFAKFVTPAAVKNIAKNIQDITSNSSDKDEEFANNVLAFVRQIPYSTSASKFPVETIVDNSGDCDVTSFLAASIMNAGGLDIVLAAYRGVPHMNIGVYLPDKPLSGISKAVPFGFEYNNKTYWVAETTPSGNWKVGEQPECFANFTTAIVPIESHEEKAPAYVSSSLDALLSPSAISITLSLEKSNANKWPLTISGSISPAESGKNVVLYVSQDLYSYKTVQTVTGNLGNYSLAWNITSTGTYYIRTSLIDFSSHAGSDSDTITVFVGSYPQWSGGNELELIGYRAKIGASEFLQRNLVGKNVSLSGEFMVLNSGQTVASGDYTMNLPGRAITKLLPNRRKLVIKVPEYTVTFKGSVQESSQVGFILQNDMGNYSASVRMLDNSDLSNMKEQVDENNTTFLNATTIIKENIWYKAVTNISNGEMSTELHDENGTILSSATKDSVVNINESGVFITFEPNSIIAFKNLKAESLDEPPSPAVDSSQPSVNGLESSVPYIIRILSLLMTTVAVATYLKKLKCNKTEFAFKLLP